MQDNKKSNKLLKILIPILILLLGVGIGYAFAANLNNNESDDLNIDTDDTTAQLEDIVDEQNEDNSLFRSSYHLDSVEGCEERENFVDVSLYDGPGEGYADPTLEVSCDEDNIIIESNNMPLWEFIALTPNPLTEQDNTFTIPKNPEFAAEPTYIGYGEGDSPTLGTLGFSVSGLVWYGPTEGPFPDPFGDPYANDILDSCGGHTGGQSEYHQHLLVASCYFLDWDENDLAPIVGYALDGFPIYGNKGCSDEDCSEVISFQSSYSEIGDIKEYAWDNVEFVADQGEEFLDECNGRIQPNGTYGYHITEGFPYVIGCFKGEFTRTNAGGAPR